MFYINIKFRLKKTVAITWSLCNTPLAVQPSVIFLLIELLHKS